MSKSLKTRLPPANALIVFESAARWLNYSTASHELAIAQPAVTRQIQKLGHNLGTPLFIRHNNKLQLTKDGEGLKSVATRGLVDIAECADRMRGTKDRITIIGSTFSFANLWLVPRLTQLRALLGQTTLNLVITDNLEVLGVCRT
jgi:LysR family glycine cleavage system transcriptional activator